MKKRPQVLSTGQKLAEEDLETALEMLQSLHKKKRLQAVKAELAFIASRPKAEVAVERNTWKREDLYDR